MVTLQRLDISARWGAYQTVPELRSGTVTFVFKSWTALDRSVTDRAFFVLFLNPKAIDFVSKRLENYQHHPEFGMLIDQVWLR